jgi:hypothetical protein
MADCLVGQDLGQNLLEREHTLPPRPAKTAISKAILGRFLGDLMFF